MTGHEAASVKSAGPCRVVTRRGLLIGSTLAIIGIGIGTAGCTSNPESPAESSGTGSERLGAMVGLPVDDADVARWRADIDTLVDHGQNLVRTGIYGWKVAPQPDRWDPASVSFYREQLDYARERGLDVNLVVPGAPDWAQNYGFDEYRAACRWFWGQMREGFGDQVDLWQAYNEADHAHYQTFRSATRDATYLAEFAGLLAVAQDTLGRDGVPVTTNLTGWPLNDEREQEWYLVLDAIGGSLDVISIDLYPADNEDEIARLPERMERVRRRYDKPVFVAEVGLQTTPDAWTETEQQQFVAAAIEQLRTAELWGIALYELRDNASPAGFGIKRADGTHKSGFADVMRALGPA